MERTIRLHNADELSFMCICPHITLGGMRRIRFVEFLPRDHEKWFIVCHECGDVFNIEHLKGE